jgi:hypothetical protein
LSFLLALLLPCVFWNKPAESAAVLRQAHISQICVPAAVANSWKGIPGISVEEIDPARYVKIPAPSITFRRDRASATRAPWVNLNGWRFLRDPQSRFYYEAKGKSAALAAAEAFAYGVRAAIQTDDSGLGPLVTMLEFLKGAGETELPPEANIGFVDDRSPESGEFMNLLVRRNLLFRVVQQPDPKLDLTVRLGTPDYPRTEAGNPSLLAEKVRAHLTDQKRRLRIYGSEMVVGRLLGDKGAARLYLLNYGAERAPVEGLRIRIAGSYAHQHAVQFDAGELKLEDAGVQDGATEFSIPELKTFAIVDLNQ